MEAMIKSQLVRDTEAVVHLYLLSGYDLASRDIGGESDPYVIIKCGKDFEYNGRDNYQLD